MDDNVNDLPDRPRIDSFMVADHAEAINGKLYIMGGGFDTIGAPGFPHFVRFSMAAVLRVPWHDTNRRLGIEAWTEDVERNRFGWQMQGEVEAGRAPGARGDDVAVTIAGPVAFQIDEPMPFVLRLNFSGDERPLALRVVSVTPGVPPGLTPPR
jgi:hypothetical protein